MYLSKEFKLINFHIFGSLQTIKLKNIDFKKYKNLIFHGFLSYSKIPSILRNSKILLMPYLEKVNVRSSNLEVSNFMSPLKLFEYLASGAIILASKLPVYSHILRNKHNAILASPQNYKDWKNKFNNITSNISSFAYLKKNALNTAKKYTWEKRVQIITNKYNEINI
jgi:glycosyltransferase involved in cell wall biosynthesis